MSAPRLVRDPDALASYLTDASGMSGGRADVAARPESHDEAAALLTAWAGDSTPVTVAGAGTGVAGGRVPLGGAILATDALSVLGEPRPGPDGESAVVRAGAGVSLVALARALEPLGWLYPLDPTESTASVGGTVATNASGPWGLVSGSTRTLVAGLRALLPDGRSVRLGRAVPAPDASGPLAVACEDGSVIEVPVRSWRTPAVRKSSAGYAPGGDAIDLLVGSEGTLAVVTEVTLRLVRRPPARVAAIFFFAAETRALSFVERVTRRASRCPPWSAELLDAPSLALASETDGALPRGAAAAVSLDRFVRSDAEERATLTAWSSCADAAGGALDAIAGTSVADLERLRALRHAVPARINERLARRGVPKVSTDTAVPRPALARWLAETRRVLEETGLEHCVFGHAGDANLHVNVLPASLSELPDALAARETIVRLAVRAGGTCAAEHGIGKLRRAALAEMFDPAEIAAMRRVRRVFDPDERLGRGTIFADEASA